MTRPFAVVFDLDGTLADTLATIANLANRALVELSLPPHPVEAYRQFVGDGIVALCQRVLPADAKERTAELLAVARRLYEQHHSDGATLYPGILELLDGLAKDGARLGVLSNKPDALTHATLKALGIHDRFDVVLGQRDDIPRKPAPDGAHWVLERLGARPDETLYVGDTATDMETARAAGLTAVGVLWGFRGRDELQSSGAQHLVATAAELLDCARTWSTALATNTR